MTPLHLEILIHFHCCVGAFPRSTTTTDDYASELMRLGLLVATPLDGVTTSAKGKAWLEHVLQTPMPIQKWVWE